jgi:hypothetical protein
VGRALFEIEAGGTEPGKVGPVLGAPTRRAWWQSGAVEADVSSSAEGKVLEAASERVQAGQSRASFVGVKVGAPSDRRVTQGKSEAGTYGTVGLGK